MGSADVILQTLAVIPDGQGGTNLLAGTAGGGVWKRPLSEIVASAAGSSRGLPSRFTLEQNYPNPFNPRTEIGFEVERTGFVLLKVFDVLGREVTTLANGEMERGSYTLTFDAVGLAGGMYFYCLTAGNQTQVPKIVLMK